MHKTAMFCGRSLARKTLRSNVARVEAQAANHPPGGDQPRGGDCATTRRFVFTLQFSPGEEATMAHGSRGATPSTASSTSPGKAAGTGPGWTGGRSKTKTPPGRRPGGPRAGPPKGRGGRRPGRGPGGIPHCSPVCGGAFRFFLRKIRRSPYLTNTHFLGGFFCEKCTRGRNDPLGACRAMW